MRTNNPCHCPISIIVFPNSNKFTRNRFRSRFLIVEECVMRCDFFACNLSLDAGPGPSWWFNTSNFETAIPSIQYAQFCKNLQYLVCDMRISQIALEVLQIRAGLSILYSKYCILGKWSLNTAKTTQDGSWGVPGDSRALMGRSW